MNYQETLDFLYAQLPVFETQGAHAYKPGLERVCEMDALLNFPHQKFRTIHVGGTNGKGSCSHTLASILQCAGYKVGLFTSPHLLDFDERIRVNGSPIDHQYVIDWVAQWQPQMAHLQPTFFELTNMMAFCYFAEQKVDVAVIEVGLGGRLDSTNIIHPDLCIITNISFDHMQFLGDTLPQIAAEQAGIMKPGVPCVIGECDDERVRFTFQQNAQLHEVSRLKFAADKPQIMWVEHEVGRNIYRTINDGDLSSPLQGACQPHNANTILTAVHLLRQQGYNINEGQLHEGFSRVLELTHLRGRWEQLADHPYVVCDTGHNEGCFSYLGPQLQQLAETHPHLHIVFGMVADKDIESVLRLLPTAATYYFCNAPTPRALPAAQLQQMCAPLGLEGACYASPKEAFEAAKNAASESDAIFVGGSNFIVCEILSLY
ncbi:MAG: folylpolyglutamate synthase/dihydrofolate synthase family protein [Bacteroidales bacterium]|nr:folylpolyglutamate synthase/dihydrofolate synthase family protein [Bacteroidales bacterium]